MDWLPAVGAAHLRGDRAARLGCSSSVHGIESIRLTGGEPTVRAHLPVLVAKLAALPVDLSLTTNGATLAHRGADLADGRAAPHQHLARLAAARPLRRAHPPRRARRRARRHRRRPRRPASPRSRSTSSCVRGVNDDEIVDFARFGRDRGRHRPLHRVHAARRRRGLDQRPGGPAGRDRRADRRRVPARARRAGHRARRAVPLPRRAGRGRRDPERHPARSASSATGSGSPPTASSAAACSRSRTTTCAALLRSGATDDELADAIEASVRGQVGRPRDRPGAVHGPAPARCRQIGG